MALPDGRWAVGLDGRAVKTPEKLVLAAPTQTAAALLAAEWAAQATYIDAASMPVTRLINSAIEANTDHISLERHPLAKRAKDMGSAAVFLTIVIALAIWGTVLWQKFA